MSKYFFKTSRVNVQLRTWPGNRVEREGLILGVYNDSLRLVKDENPISGLTKCAWGKFKGSEK